jgi:glyoxylase-like metal-dependent hydrolase (beta-lactamase superfamily II)
MRHADLQDIGPGAWAAIARPDRGAVGNAGFVDLGGAALVFDTHFSPGAARDLRAAAEERVGPVRTVANSHWHGDHVRGNPVFEEATIVATARTRELMATRGAVRLRDLKQAGLGVAAKDLRERGLSEELELLEEFERELPGLEQRLPDDTWEDRRGLGRAVLLTWGGGHSDSDAVLWLPEERIVYAADLVFVDSQPWAGDGDPRHWLTILDRIAELGPETVVPGHGPVADAGVLGSMREYLEALADGHETMPESFAALEYQGMWERNRAALAAKAQEPAV